MVDEGRERTLVTLGAKRMVVVAEVVGRKAPREEGYEMFRPLLVQRVSQEMAGQAVVDLLETLSIRNRMNVVVKPVERPSKEDEEGEETGTGTETPAGEPEPAEPPAPMPDIGR